LLILESGNPGDHGWDPKSDVFRHFLPQIKKAEGGIPGYGSWQWRITPVPAAIFCVLDDRSLHGMKFAGIVSRAMKNCLFIQ
jgi:hypothetical protein